MLIALKENPEASRIFLVTASTQKHKAMQFTLEEKRSRHACRVVVEVMNESGPKWLAVLCPGRAGQTLVSNLCVRLDRSPGCRVCAELQAA